MTQIQSNYKRRKKFDINFFLISEEKNDVTCCVKTTNETKSLERRH